MPEHAALGPAFQNQPTVQREVETPVVGRNTTNDAGAAPSRVGVTIAPDRRDHSRPPVLSGALDIELRTLVAHCERNIALHRTASTQPERDRALEEIDTRVAVALRHVPDGMRESFRTELFAQLGGDTLQRLLASAEGSSGARAASDLRIDRSSSLQLDADDHSEVPELAPEDAHAVAAEGTASGATTLPHLDAIQHSFGHHDVAHVVAHVGGAASRAANALGARAYASGNAIAFAAAPDLHLAAHEAAHIVQQRGGVSLPGGMGEVGDNYERHADAVADRVVRGESAEALLDQHASGSGGGSHAVQRVAEPRMQLEAAIRALSSTMEIETTISQLAALAGTAMPAQEYTIVFDGAAHRVAGRDVRPLLQQARARERQLALATTPATRAMLTDALARASRDALLVTRDQLSAIGESATTVQRVQVGIHPCQVAPADLAWLMARVDERLHAVDAAGAALEGPAPHESTRLPTPDAAEAERAPGPAILEGRISDRYPFSYQHETPYGRITVEGMLETMDREIGHDASGQVSSSIPHSTPSVEVVTRRGVSTGSSAASGLTGGIAISETGIARSLIEQHWHQQWTWLPGSERINGELRDGSFRGAIGWDFGGPDTTIIHESFRVDLINLSSSDGFRGPSLETRVTSDWFTHPDGTRSRFRGQISLRPNWEQLRSRLSRAEEVEPEVGAGEASDEVTAADADAQVAELATEPVGAEAGEVAGIGADAALAEAEGAAFAAGFEVVGAVVLVAAVLALAGCMFVAELVERGQFRPRRRSIAPVDRTTDTELTAYGNDIHARIRAFCLAYADVLRGTRRVSTPGTAAGRSAGQERLDLLIAQGHAAADVHAAALAAPDLDEQVLAAARPAFTEQIDSMVADVAASFHSPGAGDRQYVEWVTRHLHACIGIEPTAPTAPAFAHDVCRDDPSTVPVDTVGCLDETESNPDAPQGER